MPMERMRLSENSAPSAMISASDFSSRNSIVKGQAVHAARVVDGDDVWMGDEAGRLGLALETGEIILVDAVFGLEELDGDGAADGRIARAIDDGGRALADHLFDFIAADPGRMFHVGDFLARRGPLQAARMARCDTSETLPRS